MIFFKDVNRVPPGGLFCEIGGEKITAKTYLEMELKVRPVALRHRISQPIESVIATYMAERIDDPGEYFTGTVPAQVKVRQREAFETSMQYVNRNLVTFDKVSRRYQVCANCPQHRRDWCPTCTGHLSHFDTAFKGKRVRVPEDRVSGVCQCAKAYEYVINAVEYGPDEKVWEGAPETCWRNNDV